MDNVLLEWDTIEYSDSFDTAEENMIFDSMLLTQLKSNQRFKRIYRWKSPGITYSYKQSCPQQMATIDHAKRMTGGGIVFHSPGDIVFSIATWLNDPLYTGSLSQKLSILSNQIKHALINSGIQLDTSFKSNYVDYDHCSSYPTPFEIIVSGKKICGLTIRKQKQTCLIQGVLHVSKTSPVFYPFLSKKDYQTGINANIVF